MGPNRFRAPLAAASILTVAGALLAGCSNGIDGNASLAAAAASTPARTTTSSITSPSTPPPTASAAVDTTSAAPATPPARTTTATASTTATPPPPNAMTVGAGCDSASAIGTDVNSGDQIVCTYMGADGGYKWVGTVPIVGVNDVGDNCDSATDRVSQTPAGKAIMCVTDTWVYGP